MSGGLRIADAIMKPTSVTPDGEYIERDGEPWFKITNYDQMTPFFMSIVSDTNFWLFVSSNGGLSCGRVSAEYPIFPYYTVDKIHDEHPNTGPKTAMHVEKGGKTYLWEPFVVHPALYKTTRFVPKCLSACSPKLKWGLGPFFQKGPSFFFVPLKAPW